VPYVRATTLPPLGFRILNRLQNWIIGHLLMERLKGKTILLKGGIWMPFPIMKKIQWITLPKIKGLCMLVGTMLHMDFFVADG